VVPLAAIQRASVWRALVYFGNATAGMHLADRVFGARAPGPLALGSFPRVEVAALLAAGSAFGAATGFVVSLGRFLDTGDPAHLRPRGLGELALASVVLYVPLSFLMVTALRAGSGGGCWWPPTPPLRACTTAAGSTRRWRGSARGSVGLRAPYLCCWRTFGPQAHQRSVRPPGGRCPAPGGGARHPQDGAEHGPGVPHRRGRVRGAAA